MSNTNPSQELVKQAQKIRSATLIGLLTNILLSALKLVGGIWGSSQAVVADGVHSLSDCVTDIILLIGVKYWSKPPDECHPYGHRRIETLITVLVGFSLVAAATGLAWNAISTLHVENAPPGKIALAAAVISIVVKELLYRYTHRIGKNIKSSALKANAWHQRTDALSSVPVALAVIAAWLVPSFSVVDNIGALLVSVFILHAAWTVIRPSLTQLSDGSAPQEDIEKIKEIALSVPNVSNVHAVRTRIGGMGVFVDLHIRVPNYLTVLEGHNIATVVQQELINGGPNVLDVVVHIEPLK